MDQRLWSVLIASATLSLCSLPVGAHDVGVLAFLKDSLGDPAVLSGWGWDKEPCQPLYFGVVRCNQTEGCHTTGDENISEDRQNCRVLELNLSGLDLNGTLTFVLGDMWRLEVLDLSNNNIEGPLPAGKQGLLEMVYLQRINLANNRLSGNLSVLAEKPNLSYVNVSNNGFTESLPSYWSLIAANGTLQTLDISGNDLSGPVPEEFKNIPQFVYLPGNAGLCNDAFQGLPPCPGSSPRAAPAAAPGPVLAPSADAGVPLSAPSATPATLLGTTSLTTAATPVGPVGLPQPSTIVAPGQSGTSSSTQSGAASSTSTTSESGATAPSITTNAGDVQRWSAVLLLASLAFGAFIGCS